MYDKIHYKLKKKKEKVNIKITNILNHILDNIPKLILILIRWSDELIL